MVGSHLVSFAQNRLKEQQLSLFDPLNTMTEKEKKFLDRSWVKYFAKFIFPRLMKSHMLSYKAIRAHAQTRLLMSRSAHCRSRNWQLFQSETARIPDVWHPVPVCPPHNVFTEQPLSDRTLSRFRAMCAAYETEHGVDLLHETTTSLSSEMAELMRIDSSLKRMDSLMIESNIKRMGVWNCSAPAWQISQKRWQNPWNPRTSAALHRSGWQEPCHIPQSQWGNFQKDRSYPNWCGIPLKSRETTPRGRGKCHRGIRQKRKHHWGLPVWAERPQWQPVSVRNPWWHGETVTMWRMAPKIFKRISRKTVSSKSNQRAKQQRKRAPNILKSRAIFGTWWRQCFYPSPKIRNW